MVNVLTINLSVKCMHNIIECMYVFFLIPADNLTTTDNIVLISIGLVALVAGIVLVVVTTLIITGIIVSCCGKVGKLCTWSGVCDGHVHRLHLQMAISIWWTGHRTGLWDWTRRKFAHHLMYTQEICTNIVAAQLSLYRSSNQLRAEACRSPTLTPLQQFLLTTVQHRKIWR